MEMLCQKLIKIKIFYGYTIITLTYRKTFFILKVEQFVENLLLQLIILALERKTFMNFLLKTNLQNEKNIFMDIIAQNK